MDIRKIVWQPIRENAKKRGIYIDFVNGYSDHCHCLISMGVNQSIQQIMKLIKGESFYWINKQGILSASAPPLTNVIKPIFEWQEESYAASVSASSLAAVRNYIRNQEVHHSKKPFNLNVMNLISTMNRKNILIRIFHVLKLHQFLTPIK